MEVAYSAAGDFEKGIGDKSSADPIGNGIGEGHQEQSDKRWNCLLVACPWNVLNNGHHHQPYKDQTRRCCFGWNYGSHRAEQNGTDEEQSHEDSSEARPAALANTGGTLDVERIAAGVAKTTEDRS